MLYYIDLIIIILRYYLTSSYLLYKIS